MNLSRWIDGTSQPAGLVTTWLICNQFKMNNFDFQLGRLYDCLQYTRIEEQREWR